MSQMRRDARLETRDARKKLKARHAPYWRTIHKGLALGYRKGPTGGVWMVRFYGPEDAYKFARIGTADDYQDATGRDVLDFKQAQKRAMEKATEAEKQDRSENIQLGLYTVGMALDDYLRKYKADGKSLKATETTINAHIRPKLGEIEAQALIAKRIRAWMQALAEAPRRIRGKEMPLDADAESLRRRKASANRVMTVLKAALNFAYHEGRIPSADEWRKVKPFGHVDAPKIRHLTTAEAKRLANACNPDFRQLVRAALLTGCRYGELISLEVADYHAAAKVIQVRQSKSGKPRYIPLTDEGVKFFASLTVGRLGHEILFQHNGAPWGKSHQSRPMREACNRTKITPPISFHDLRHTYASLLATAGTPLQVIARALGHADTRMTERHYAHLSPDHVAEQIRANLPKFGIKGNNVKAISV